MSWSSLGWTSTSNIPAVSLSNPVPSMTLMRLAYRWPTILLIEPSRIMVFSWNADCWSRARFVIRSARFRLHGSASQTPYITVTSHDRQSLGDRLFVQKFVQATRKESIKARPFVCWGAVGGWVGVGVGVGDRVWGDWGWGWGWLWGVYPTVDYFHKGSVVCK